MNRLRKFLAYGWALMAVPIILITFIGMDGWAKKLVDFTGLKVSPLYTGGEVVQTIKHEGYETLIHRPVFDGLVCERKNGFVQIGWKATRDRLPELIDETIDFDRDGKDDFRIELNTTTNNGRLEGYSPGVVSLGKILVLKNERVVRVSLKKD
ncbi:MAG: hypothetical protein ABSG82_02585 [Sedimentisphaerales bacterium]|jgi:hypothetical protein